MKRKKQSKNSKETNINNTIKSILLSSREINYKNLKFSIFKEILKSDKLEEIMVKKTFDFRNLVIHYKDEINNDPGLENAQYYFTLVENIRISRVNKILESGKSNDIIINKLKDNIRDSEIEDNWKERNYTHFKLKNGTVQLKIETKEQLDYQIKLLETETLNNIITKELLLEPKLLDNWLIDMQKYSLQYYSQSYIINKNTLLIGENSIQKEMCFLFYCLTDAKIHIIHRIKYK